MHEKYFLRSTKNSYYGEKVMDNQKMPIIYLRNVTYAWRHHSGRWIKTATLSVEQCGSFLFIVEKSDGKKRNSIYYLQQQ